MIPTNNKKTNGQFFNYMKLNSSAVWHFVFNMTMKSYKGELDYKSCASLTQKFVSK